MGRLPDCVLENTFFALCVVAGKASIRNSNVSFAGIFFCRTRNNPTERFFHPPHLPPPPRPIIGPHNSKENKGALSHTHLLGDGFGHDLQHVFVLQRVRQAAPHWVVLRAAAPNLSSHKQPARKQERKVGERAWVV